MRVLTRAGSQAKHERVDPADQRDHESGSFDGPQDYTTVRSDRLGSPGPVTPCVSCLSPSPSPSWNRAGLVLVAARGLLPLLDAPVALPRSDLRGARQQPRAVVGELTYAALMHLACAFRRARPRRWRARRRPRPLVRPCADALHAPRAALVVMDRGIATEERLRWLRELGYRYLVVNRERTRHFDPEAALRIETASKHGVHLHKVLSDDGQEVRLYCFSEERAAKERGIVERFAQRFGSVLSELSQGLSKPRTRKRIDQVWRRIGRLKEKSRGIAQHYDIELDTDNSAQRATAVRFTRRALPGSMMTHPGVYCLRSSETDWDEATL